MSGPETAEPERFRSAGRSTSPEADLMVETAGAAETSCLWSGPT